MLVRRPTQYRLAGVVGALLGIVMSSCTATQDGSDWSPPPPQPEPKPTVRRSEPIPLPVPEQPAEPEPEMTPLPEPTADWVCRWSPTMNRDWHDDALCSTGSESERPYLRPWDDFVTPDELMESAREYERQRNGD